MVFCGFVLLISMGTFPVITDTFSENTINVLAAATSD